MTNQDDFAASVERATDAAWRLSQMVDYSERKGWLPGLPIEVKAALTAYRKARDRTEGYQ